MVGFDTTLRVILTSSDSLKSDHDEIILLQGMTFDLWIHSVYMTLILYRFIKLLFVYLWHYKYNA